LRSWCHGGNRAQENEHQPDPEQEKIFNEELKSGHFHCVEEVIGEARLYMGRRSLPLLARLREHSARLCAKCLPLWKNRVRLEGLVKELIHG
jgi:hypothetical protein